MCLGGQVEEVQVSGGIARGGEAGEIGKDRGEVSRGDAEPFGENAAVLIDGGGGDVSATCVDALGAVGVEVGVKAVEV